MVLILALGLSSSVLADAPSSSGIRSVNVHRPLPTENSQPALREAVPAFFRVDPAALASIAPGSILRLQPFDDVTVEMRVEDVTSDAAGTSILTGRVDDDAARRFKLYRRGELLAGSIRLDAEREIQIFPGEDSQHRAVETIRDRTRHCGVSALEQERIDRERLTATSSSGTMGNDHLVEPRGVPVPTGCDDGTVIDLLIVYTTEARIAAGGTAAIVALINFAVADTNLAFTNSQINTSIFLVHTAEVAYTETGNSLVDGPLLLAGDGALAPAHTLREFYGADLVGLWVNNLEVGGRVFAPTNPSGKAGFHEMRWDNWDLHTMAHEIGHNLGCAHDLPNSFDDAYFPYSYGYVDPLDQWHTVMAVFQPNPTIPHFSNPNVNYDGRPTGDAFADNALTINQTRHIVANYRVSPVFGLPSVLRVNAAASPGGNGTTWATAFNDLQDALCQAARSRGDVQEIWVAQGTYKPDLGSELRQLSFRLQNGVALYGGFFGNETLRSQRDPIAYPTILSGDVGLIGDSSDNTMHVVVAEDVDATAVLDGFVIRNGNADAESVFFFIRGGGMRVLYAGPTIENCRFEHNAAGQNGGAIYCEAADPIISFCTFTKNLADPDFFPGGGAMTNMYGSAPQVSDCTFSLNLAGYVGGAIANYDSPAVFTRCTFACNQSAFGGAVENGPGSSASFINCGFHGNIADIHGGAFDIIASDPLIAGCVFTGNIALANYGGAMTTFANSSPTIVNCTMVANDGGAVGGAIANDSDGPTVTNCILWDNVADFGTTEAQQIWNFAGQTYVDSTILQGWTGAMGGLGNNGLDPRFIDPVGRDGFLASPDDDVRLLPGSPAIDSGDNTALPVELVSDFGGLSRRVDIPAIPDTGVGPSPVVDRGAHEFTPSQCQSGDFDGDGLVTPADISLFVQAVLTAPPGSCIGDLNNDGFHDALDAQRFAEVLVAP